MTSITENILAFVETPAGEPRPSAPPYGYVWADEYFTKVDVGTDGQPATRWPVALQVDVAVVGGGPVGLSTAHMCAKEGKTVAILEKYVLYNASGSSADFMRMFRTMYTEDYMADLAHEAISQWDALERESGERMIERTGLLNFGNPKYESGPEGNLMAPKKNLDRLKMPYKEMSADEIMAEYPFKNLPETFKGLFALDNGVINVPLLLRTLTRLCSFHGAKIYENAGVNNMETSEFGVKIEAVDTQTGEKRLIYAKKAALTCGAYVNDVLKPNFGFELDLDIWDMSYEYYTVQASTYFKSMWFQFENPDDPDDPNTSNLYYGFPAVAWGPESSVRIAVDNASAKRRIKSPSEREVGPSQIDLKRTQEWCKKHLPGVDPTPCFSGSCLQTNVYDNMYVLDYLPEKVGAGSKNVVVFTAGWAMKMVPMLGSMLKDLLLHPDQEPSPVRKEGLLHFSIQRSDGDKSVILWPDQVPRRLGGQSFLGMQGDGRKKSLLRHCLAMGKTPSSLRAAPLRASAPVTSTIGPIHVGVLGAGMAGLYAALLLQSLDISCEVLEAAPQPGGRVRTHHFSDQKWDYIDLGAMRFPDIDIMDRVGANLEPKPWSLVGKLNEDALKRGEPEPLKIGEYALSAKNTITMYNGVWKIGDVDWAKDPFGFSKTRGGNVPDKYVMGPIAGLELRKPNGQLMTPDEWEGPSSLLSVVIEPYVHELNKDFETGFKKLMSIDKQTMREMLFERYKSETCAETIVTFIETAGSEVTGYFEKAASEVVIDNMDFTSPDGKPTPWYLFEGGTSTLTDAMFDSVRASGANPVKVDHQVRKLAFTEQTKKIIVSGVEAVDGKPLGEGNPFEYQYSHVITTMTNHAFRLVDTTDCRLTVAKKTAIRCLTYDHSTKVALKFKTRFWEQGPSPIKGGSSTTDMPIRQCVYPSYGTADDTGVIIASYSWADDADFMGNLSVHDEARAVELCIKNIATLHGRTYDDLKDECIDYKFMDWAAEKNAQGAYAMFTPGQYSSQFRDLISPSTDERLFFAGEHASHHHAWIVGSLNSAYRSVDSLLAREGLTAKRYELREKWGECAESDVEIEDRYPWPPQEAVADQKAVADFKTKANPVPNGKAAKGLLCGWRQVPNGL